MSQEKKATEKKPTEKKATDKKATVMERWVIEAVLELVSPCHIGGIESGVGAEQPLLRDGLGRPYLAGTSLAGVFRSLLTRCEPTKVEHLLGHGVDTRRGEGLPSLLRVDDAQLEPLETDPGGAEHTDAARSSTRSSTPARIEVRQGVQIDAETGLAEDQKLYDIELLPTGTRFRLHLELELLGDQRSEEAASLLLSLLHTLETQGFHVGRRTRRGYGEVCIAALRPTSRASSETASEHDIPPNRWWFQRHRMAHKAELLSWLLSERGGTPSLQGFASVEALSTFLGRPLTALTRAGEDILTLEAVLTGSLLIRSAGHGMEDADARPLTRIARNAGRWEEQPIVSGTSLAGVLRAQCLRIASTLAGPARHAAAQTLIGRLFGHMHDGDKGRASCLRVGEACIMGGKQLRHTRVRLDPFTGGALDRFLFTNDAQYGGHISVALALDSQRLSGGERDAALALLLLALRDLVTGRIALGGEGGTGRGGLMPGSDGPFLTICWQDGQTEHIHLSAQGGLELSDPACWDKRLRVLHEQLRVLHEQLGVVA